MSAADLPIPSRFLAGLPREDLDRLRPDLETLDLGHRHVLFDAGDPIEHIYFPDGGMVSLLIKLEDGALLEVGVVGKEGLVGLSALLGLETASHQAMVQIPGKAARIGASALREQVHRSPALLDRVHRYAQAFQIQVSQTAACNARHNLQERLAKWILMAHDRAESDVLPLTQEFMSMMLGVRRAGVTVAVNILKNAGAILTAQGRVTVVDRQRLEDASCECYGMAKQQAERLLG